MSKEGLVSRRSALLGRCRCNLSILLRVVSEHPRSC